MRRSGRSRACVGTLVAACAVGVAGPPAASAATPRAELKSLVQQVRALPPGAVVPGARRRLLITAGLARRQAGRSQCSAVRTLTRFRTTLRRIKVKRAKRLSRTSQRVLALGPTSLRASRALLLTPATRRCGGGVKPSRVTSATTTILQNDAKGITARVQLPDVRFVPRSGGGRSWTQLVLPNTDSPQEPGQPGIPVVSSQFAIPAGATVSVEPGKVTSYTVEGVDVFPAQPESVDQGTPSTKRPDFTKPPFATKPFELDAAAYRRGGLTPAAPVAGGVLGDVRDLKIGNLDVPAVQYDPKAGKVKVLQSVEFRIVFGGDNSGQFAPELGSPWERAARSGLTELLNSTVVRANIRGGLILQPCGEELLIVTNAATRPAADTLKVARSRAGFLSRVVETGNASGQAGTTAAQIQSYIRGRLTSRSCIHPSYVVFMGDDELVPTFTPTISGVLIPSDLPYSLRDDSDELPDVAVGRIIGNDQAQVQTAVDKIVAYETTAPSAGDFLTHATVAAQFQDDEADGQENRTFIQFAETVRNGLVRRGVRVDRIYDDSPAATPLRFNDGTNLPAELRRPTFAWNGSGADVTRAWNEGRFLMVHRDHGWSQGWGDPGFTSGNVNALTNGSLLPVVLSINCSSGAYDYDESSFATTALTRRDGGAVGIFGDTRDSPSWHNTQIALGFVDGMLPSILPSEGPGAKQRVGDALINGKVRLAGLSDPRTSGSSRQELYLWHYFGDPTMQLWGGGKAPLRFDIRVFQAVLFRELSGPRPGPDPPPYEVRVTLPKELVGQPISLLRGGEVIGKAIAGDGSAVIPALFGDGSVKQGDLRIAVEGDDAQAVDADVQVPAPPAPPTPTPTPTTPVPPPPVATTLTQSCPARAEPDRPLTVRGSLAGAPTRATVAVTFRAPSFRLTPGRVETVNATTAADGSWSASVTPNANNETGTWTIGSAYAGDSDHVRSSAGPCSVPVEFPEPVIR